MNTTTVQSSELGDDWTPAAHMPRIVTEIRNVRSGDHIRVRDHRGTLPGEPTAKWHRVVVLDTDELGQMVAVAVDKWPVAYVAARDTLVEVLAIDRQVTFICTRCHANDLRNVTVRTVTLENFYDPQLLRSGGLRVLKLHSLDAADQNGLCPEHTTTLLD